jgi:hypothetical protein
MVEALTNHPTAMLLAFIQEDLMKLAGYDGLIQEQIREIVDLLKEPSEAAEPCSQKRESRRS